MASNPSSRLRDTLANWHPAEPVMVERQYQFLSRPPPLMDTTIEHLRYIKYQPFVGVDEHATTQECTDLATADRHWCTQKMYDSRYLIHPKSCVRHEDKYILIFQTVMREFKFWVKAHGLGEVTDADMWKAFIDIGKNMKYLSTVDRPHGNLGGGIGITTDVKAFFFNLGADTSRQKFGDDVQALHDFLDVTEARFSDLRIRACVTGWKSFLSKSCPQSTQVCTPLPHSQIYPLYAPNHVKMVFHYPTSLDADEKLQFLQNIDRLCTDRDNNRPSLKLNQAFINSLTAHYRDWPTKLKGRLILEKVYDYGYKLGIYTRRTGANSTLSVPSIVTFAHNCAKHYNHTVQKYNNVHGTRVRQLRTASEILDELYTVFPFLVERIYEAFYMALVSGYNHPVFSVEQILTEGV